VNDDKDLVNALVRYYNESKSEDTMKKKSSNSQKEFPFVESLRKTFKELPKEKIDIKKEWYKYLEEKYGG